MKEVVRVKNAVSSKQSVEHTLGRSVRNILRPLLAATACFVACESLIYSASAATVGYWRFESDAFLSDTGGNAAGPFNLTNEGGNNGNDVYALPTTGPGSAVPKTIPLTSSQRQRSLVHALGDPWRFVHCTLQRCL